MLKNNEVSRDKKIEMQSINDNQFMIFTTDMKGKITYCNDVFAQTFDLERKDIENKKEFIEFKHPKVISLIYKDMWTELAEKGQWDGLLEKAIKDKEFWIDTYIIKSMLDEQQVGYTGIAKRTEDSNIIHQADNLLYKKYGNYKSEQQ